MRRPRLIQNWKQGWRMFSNQAMTLAGALQATWALLDAEQRAALPPNAVHWVSIGILVAGIVGRLVDQPKVKQ